MTATTAFLRLYTNTDDVLGDLWQYDDMTMARARKPGQSSVSITVRNGTPSADLLDRDFLFARPVIDGTEQDIVFVLSETEDDDRHPDGDVRPIRATFEDISVWLENAEVYPENVNVTATGALTEDDSTDGNKLVMGHRFADQNAGAIMSTLISRAKQRGALTRISTDFGASTDSNGTSWTADDEMDETFTVGTSYKAVLDSLAGINWCHYDFTGFTLQLFRPDTLGADKPGVVMVGQDNPAGTRAFVTAAPRRKRRLDAKTAMLVHGDQQALYEAVDTAAKNELGRREGFYRRGGVYQLATITKLANLALNSQKNVTESLTLSMVADACPFTPGVDYDLWDRIYYDGLPGEPLRVNTITQRWTAQGETTVELELLDRLSDLADKLAKLLERVQQPNAPDAELPGRIDPIATIPPSDSDFWPDFDGSYNDYLGADGGYFGMLYIQCDEPQGVGKGTWWYNPCDRTV